MQTAHAQFWEGTIQQETKLASWLCTWEKPYTAVLFNILPA